MTTYYSDIDWKRENEFINIIKGVLIHPGAIIGCSKVTELYTFLSGMDYMFMLLKGYRLHFDQLFQCYVENSYNVRPGVRHWDTIITEGKTDEQAFDSFCNLFQGFIESNGHFICPE